MIDFTPYLNDDKLPIMNREQFDYITDKYGKEKFREDLAEYISVHRPPFPFKNYTREQMIDNFLKLKSFDTTKNLTSRNKIEKKVFEKYDDYKHNFEKYGLGIIDCASTYNLCSNYFHEQLRLRCPCYSFEGPAEVWEKGNAKDIHKIIGALWRGISSYTLDNANYLGAIRLGTYIATQFKPVVAKAIYDMTDAKVVLDTSCGWGDRLAGFYSSNATHYIGCDPNPNTFEIYKKQCIEYEKILGNSNPDITEHKDYFFVDGEKKVTIYRSGAENIPWGQIDNIDCSFTSPPYFSTEEYNKGGEHEEDQSWHKFNEYNKWQDNFFVPVSLNCIERSKHTLINIMDPKVKGKRYYTSDYLIDKVPDMFRGQIGMRIMQRPKNLKDKEQHKEYMNDIYIENVWCFSKDKDYDYFKYTNKQTLENFLQ
jgi:hypothetical protein